MNNIQQIISSGYTRSAVFDDHLSHFDLKFNRKLLHQIGVEENLKVMEYRDSFDNCYISNAIIDVKSSSFKETSTGCFSLLESLGTRHIAVRTEGKFEIPFLKDLVSEIENFNIHEFTLITSYSKWMFSDDFASALGTSIRFDKAAIFGSPFNKNFGDKFFFLNKNIRVRFDKHPGDFFVNKTLFHESINKNTYFNRKLYINSEGEIYNAPESKIKLGEIENFSKKMNLKELIRSSDLWGITKEKIDICKDCEYRRVCIDNRVPQKRADQSFYNELECNYNPYIAKWKGEEGYRNLAECGVVSNAEGFSIDHEKISKINEEIWGE